ncbi:MAG TPA: hypothetical protein VFL95_09460 [Gemmatimonadales bacterium]|nr:hypothetical protein [Gemmatimonadales bacterium]
MGRRKQKKVLDPDARYFRFLGRLRAGGRSNMYGAIPYVVAAFDVEREEAFRVVCRWMDLQAAPEAHNNGGQPYRRVEPVVVGRLPQEQTTLALEDQPASPRKARKKAARKPAPKRKSAARR